MRPSDLDATSHGIRQEPGARGDQGSDHRRSGNPVSEKLAPVCERFVPRDGRPVPGANAMSRLDFAERGCQEYGSRREARADDGPQPVEAEHRGEPERDPEVEPEKGGACDERSNTDGPADLTRGRVLLPGSVPQSAGPLVQAGHQVLHGPCERSPNVRSRGPPRQVGPLGSAVTRRSA